jgi:protein subunit release factor A
MKLDIKDVQFEFFSGHGPGGQNRNRKLKCVRALHQPTGIVVTATRERSREQNIVAALKALEERLVARWEEKLDSLKKARHASKRPASFGGETIRTYRLTGKDMGVLDHATGTKWPVGVLDGALLDKVIQERQRKGV